MGPAKEARGDQRATLEPPRDVWRHRGGDVDTSSTARTYTLPCDLHGGLALAPNRWKQVEAILDEALAAGRDEWSAILDVRCRDDVDLRREVEALLRRVDTAKDFLQEVP